MVLTEWSWPFPLIFPYVGRALILVHYCYNTRTIKASDKLHKLIAGFKFWFTAYSMGWDREGVIP